MRTNDFRIEERHDDGVCILAVSGELDLQTAPALCAAIDRGRRAADQVVVDLSSVTFCDSRGLTALFGEGRETAIAGGRLSVVLPGRPGARRIFDLTGAAEVLSLYPTRDAALATA